MKKVSIISFLLVIVVGFLNGNCQTGSYLEPENDNKANDYVSSDQADTDKSDRTKNTSRHKDDHETESAEEKKSVEEESSEDKLSDTATRSEITLEELEFEETGNEEYDFYLKKAIDNFKKENWSEARRFLKMAEKRSDHYSVHYMKGRLHLVMGSYQDAVEHMEKALDIRSKDPRVHFYLGRVYEEMGKPKLAQNQYLNVLQLSPSKSIEEQTRKYLTTD